ncbi:12501_t:CDS:2, partial [Cetraspora pellucida]
IPELEPQGFFNIPSSNNWVIIESHSNCLVVGHKSFIGTSITPDICVHQADPQNNGGKLDQSSSLFATQKHPQQTPIPTKSYPASIATTSPPLKSEIP